MYMVNFKFTWYCVAIILMLIILTVISFLCFRDNFPPKKYQRDLDKHPYTRIELYYPPITAVILSCLVIIIASNVLKKLGESEDAFRNVKCQSHKIGMGFINGYSEEEAKQYSP